MAARWLGAVLLGSLALAGCGSDDDSESGSDDSESGSVLSEASPYFMAESGWFQFTDWAAVKSEFGGEDLTSESSEGEQQEFFETISEEAAIGSDYLATLDDDVVGFGPLDLEWEAQVLGEDQIVNVLGFPGGFDFESVESALADCGYEESEVDGGTLFEKAPAEPCAGEEPFSSTPDPSLAAIAVLPDAGVAVTSSDAEAVTAAIEGDGGPLDAVEDDLGSQLDDALAGYVAFGDACDAVSVSGGSASPEQVEALEKEIGDLGGPYEIFLASYVDDGDGISGRFVLDFASSDEAESQLEARSDAFENARSLVTGEPYSDIYSLDSAEAEEDAIVFEASSVDGPNPLLQSVVQRDLPFAAC